MPIVPKAKMVGSGTRAAAAGAGVADMAILPDRRRTPLAFRIGED
jgi:hypothetical protein